MTELREGGVEDIVIAVVAIYRPSTSLVPSGRTPGAT
jgi:hypothetical protein